MEAVLKTIYDGILEGNAQLVQDEVQNAIDQGLEPAVILNQGMITAMSEVGALFEAGEYFVPEMLIAARAMQAGLALIKPLLLEADVKVAGKVAIGTVKGDLHDIGKNLVAMMLEGAGFEIIDLGTDVPADRFVEAVRTRGADMVAMSALLTTTMGNMQSTVEALKSAGLRESVKVMVGGAPVTKDYAQQIGADGYAEDASRAVALAKSLVK
jgi:5-methyltetrahydrofolate--homocysteine methyltransferase